MHRISCCLFIAFAGNLANAKQPPNVMWIVADDLGPELGCYDYHSVATPNIDRLTTNGIRYTAAFSTSPVCSASRTAFQTGQYQTTVGGHHHDHRDKPTLPPSIPTVTDLMRNAGYFVSNGRGEKSPAKKLAKSHFNFVYDSRTFFDGHDWSGRDKDQPFFAQVQIKEPHRPFVENSRKYPDAVIPPYYPDHPVTRADWNSYLASIEALDQKVGQVLDRLDDEGLAENTAVFFFGDHGRPHVRGKQWLYDGGLHVPMLVRWPARFKEPVVRDGLVSLLDLVPTTLAIAGVPAPKNAALMGLNLLDAGWQGHANIIAARDRCGEASDRIRCVRTKQWKYIRNFRTDLPYMQHSSYKRLSYPVDTLMRVLHERGEWDSPFMAASRPKEELYDLRTDPAEMHNLATDPNHSGQLNRMRATLDDWIEQTGDKGAIDEGLTVDMDKLRAGKWAWFEKTMRSRGLNSDSSNDDYLQWWKSQLGVE